MTIAKIIKAIRHPVEPIFMSFFIMGVELFQLPCGYIWGISDRDLYNFGCLENVDSRNCAYGLIFVRNRSKSGNKAYHHRVAIGGVCMKDCFKFFVIKFLLYSLIVFFKVKNFLRSYAA